MNILRQIFKLIIVSSTFLLILFVNNSKVLALSTPEYIQSYNSNIEINYDGSLSVTETITVNALRIDIKRGIYRDFPTKYTENGINYNTTFEITEVLRDGSVEPYHIENAVNGKRLYIGDADVYIDNGIHVYTIKYNTNRQLGYFEDHDELYFNAIGTGWSFDIYNGLVNIRLPKGVYEKDIAIDAFTGAMGESGKDYIGSIFTEGDYVYASFYLTDILAPGEGLTLAVSWPKGYVYEPTQLDRINYVVLDNIILLIGIVLFLINIIYFIVTWFRFGKDPKGRLIVTEYDAPDGISPAMVRYINEMGFDNKAFTSAIISMAIKRYIKIIEKKGDFSIEYIGKNREKLSKEELVIADELLPIGKTTVFKFISSKNTKIVATIKKVKDLFIDDYKDIYFKDNFGLLAFPIATSVLSLLLMISSTSIPAEFATIAGLLIGFTIFVCYLIKSVIDHVINVRFIKNKVIYFISIFLYVCLMIILAFVVWLLFSLSVESGGIFVTVVTILTVLFNFFYICVIKRRTTLGREIQDHIVGLKRYLTATETSRYTSELHEELPHTLDVYEKYLPYAVALGVDPIWASRFKDLIDSNKEVSETSAWYSGTNSNAFTSSLGSSFTNSITIASSTSSSGSSSGFSGGSSGGGGGGGGGGGW